VKYEWWQGRRKLLLLPPQTRLSPVSELEKIWKAMILVWFEELSWKWPAGLERPRSGQPVAWPRLELQNDIQLSVPL
jgi:hypothetical protein